MQESELTNQKEVDQLEKKHTYKNGEEILPIPPDAVFNAEGCYHLACAVIEMATQPPRSNSTRDHRQLRIDFANHSPMIEMLADCSDALEAGRIRQAILKINQ
jgi:hypothetical protein